MTQPSSRTHLVRRAVCTALLPAFFASATCALPAFAATMAAASTPLRFDFSGQPKAGATSVRWNDASGAPLFDAATGYGFVTQTGALPARAVHVKEIRHDGRGFVISEPVFEAEKGFESAHYNQFGMAFRVKLPPGAYHLQVRTTSDAADTTVSVSGMQSSRLLPSVFWDAASLLPNQTSISHQGKEWTYRYVNGREFIDIEVEPKRVNVPVGLEEIVITPIPVKARPAGTRPAIYTLGDSTVKSYTFDEAPMSGWGQVFDHLFDPARVKVVNYSMGGRSFRNAYAEGRLNDLLLTGHAGDILMIQFGHNDESQDDARRFGRGATEGMYETMIREIYLPAIRARGMVPVFVTPMSRVNGNQKAGEPYVNSFKTRRFPDLMKKLGAEHGVPVLDLNARSVEFYNQAGIAATTAMVMSIEAGETPGKTNDGSYANGHPSNKIDGTHFKESMAKQYARIVATEIGRLAAQGQPVAASMHGHLRSDVKQAIASGDWTAIHPEIASDIVSGDNAYYRNQIEKLLQLGALRKDGQGRFNPQASMQTSEFGSALARLMTIPAEPFKQYGDGPLTREKMGAMVLDAYRARFKTKPAYMTDYNGKTVLPGMPGYDPNLDSGAQGAMYYPLVRWTQLTDIADVSPSYLNALQEAYELGLIRSEAGIQRGRMINGRLLEPKTVVTRAKAAKSLYFMWVLAQAPKAENDGVAP